MIYRLTKNSHFWVTLLGDVVLVLLAYYCAYLIRFEGAISPEVMAIFIHTAWWICLLKISCFFVFDMYKGMWRYFSLHDLINLIKACLLAFGITTIIILSLHRFEGYSRSVFFIDLLLCMVFTGGFRLSIRIVLANDKKDFRGIVLQKYVSHMKNLLIVGAGNAGEKLLRELNENSELKFDVVGFIDDDPLKVNQTIHGIPVLGSLQDLEKIVRKYSVHEIIIAMPSATARQMRKVVGYCKNAGVPFKTLPGIGELVEGRVTASAVRNVRYEDLLGRKPVELNLEEIGGYLKGKRVMVTGAAGSIGSELCRQIARYKPRQLILVERNESALYELELALKRQYSSLETVAVLATIQHRGLLAQVFDSYLPQTVFHAAAYKHVPMMELHPWEAVFNNIVGSKIILDLCANNGVERCVVVSTDKAVRPTNVMGATKRVVELLTKCYAIDSRCRFIAVRFGNVLGSAGSVLPLFKAQIEAGGPLTVTHPEMTRFFMTIPEACSLILEAGSIGQGNEILILKMGTPVNIESMARDMITLSGFIPDKEIEIHHTGLRPGEKLYEELITEGEDVMPTTHDNIMMLKAGACLPASVIDRHIDKLMELALKRDAYGIKMALCAIVPEYCPQMKDDQQRQRRSVISFDEVQLKRISNDEGVLAK